MPRLRSPIAGLIQSIARLRRALSRAAAAELAPHGVGPRQLTVLRELREAGPLSQVELSRATRTDPAGMMRTIDSLEERGWVRRDASPMDRRAKIVSLTAAGVAAVRSLGAPYDALRAIADGSLSGVERRQFESLAGRLATAFDAAAEAATPPTPPRTRAGGRRPEHR